MTSGENILEFSEVLEIEELEENYDVYDITVEDTHNFFANGMLVHNCIGGVLGNDYWRNRELGASAVRQAMEKTIKEMMDIFGDRFYGELQWANYAEQHIINQHIIELSKVYGFQLISTCDAHFPSPDLWKDREIYKMIGWMGKKDDGNQIDALPQTLEEMEYQLYPKNGDELYASYRAYSSKLGFTYDDGLIEESIARTADIARNRISAYTPDTSVKLPSFVVPEGQTADATLAKLAVQNLKDSGLYKDQEYIDRLKEELHTIRDRGFSKYFLTMKTITDKAKERMLAGAGRGSGAGSLVSYLLNITEVDPIKYKLQFSRFIRKNTTDYPDIDFDVADNMTLKEELIREYGDNVVVPISNFNTLKPRSLIKDISKLYDIPFQEANDVTGNMIFEAKGPAMKDHGMTAGAYEPTWEELKKYSPSLANYLTKYPHVGTHVENLLRQIRSCFTDRVKILTNNGQKYINEICQDDKIAFLTNHNSVEYNDDYEVIYQGKKEVFNVELEDGTLLELTADHQVMTQDGYKKVSDLLETDFLVKL